MPDTMRFGTVRMTPSTEPSSKAIIHATTAMAMVQPNPEMYQSR